MENMLKANDVQEKHAALLVAIESVDVAFKALMLLTPEGEKKPGQKNTPRLFSQDMMDSAQHIGRALKVVRLDSLVIAQSIMGFTEEAREAAIEANKASIEAQAAQGAQADGKNPLMSVVPPAESADGESK